MSEALRLFFTNSTDETLAMLGWGIFIIVVLLASYWIYNRKNFHKLGHQIPASVVKNYLDSIIQNSNSLKSSLFRGGGLELGEGIMPSVMPVSSLPASNSDSGELINQKNAEIASLRGQVSDKQSQITELEKRLEDMKSSAGGVSADAEAEIAKLKADLESTKAQLAAAGSSSGGDAEMQSKLDAVTKERDELKERLQEYEIIEDDLANLKKLQQENEQLKQSLGGAAPVAAAPAPEVAAAPAPEVAAVPAPEVAAVPAAAAVGGGVPATNSEDGKSAEDLLSEFEQMLG